MQNKRKEGHTFHIPVMGIGFTIDTPLKVAQYGINSVLSLGDDMLIEKMRKHHSLTNKVEYKEITNKTHDFRAKRITSYLNLLNDLAKKKIDELINAAIEKSADLKKYFDMLPDGEHIKEEFNKLTSKYINQNELTKWLKENLTMGSIDVNVMTKVDKENYTADGELLPPEYNNAYAAIRGFAKSNLSSSLILSAGMHPRLYGYMENFEDFFPDENGEIKKKIVLKVSDYRSAIIQGKFLAKKGLWVSEYRIESGLNCGGHAFATDGYLLGPILAEFRDKKEVLIDSIFDILKGSFERLGRTIPNQIPVLKITAQGGVGTSEEHKFLLEHYNVDSVGWGTPFLLVPEATNVDIDTMDRLIEAKEKDLYLSNISPLGVPFNNLRGNSKDLEKDTLKDNGRPGSKCPKKYLTFNRDYSDQGMCTASRQFQRLKIKELSDANLEEADFKKKYDKVVEKSCICVGLGTSVLLVNDIDHKVEGTGVSICPGPNMAYFSSKMSLEEIANHIYGRSNKIARNDRPMMFVKELNIYIDYLKDKIEEAQNEMNKKQHEYFITFTKNLEEGVSYYKNLFGELKESFKDEKQRILEDLDLSLDRLNLLSREIEKKLIIIA